MQPEQKIVIDVAALFAKLVPEYKWIGVTKRGGVFAFTRRPEPNEIGGFAGGGSFTTIETERQLFERPRPSAWKIEDCDLSDDASILWRFFDSEGKGDVRATSAQSMRYAKQIASHRLQVEWCEIPE